MIPFSDPLASYLANKNEIDHAIRRVLESGWFVLGQEVEVFEKEFAAFHGEREAGENDSRRKGPGRHSRGRQFAVRWSCSDGHRERGRARHREEHRGGGARLQQL